MSGRFIADHALVVADMADQPRSIVCLDGGIVVSHNARVFYVELALCYTKWCDSCILDNNGVL